MAASGPGVSVLAPNGRRQNVRVTPGTPLLQVLEEVCKKQNFNPREYNLKFQRTVLDLSVQWRFANLPNNAKLEMVSCSQQRAGVEKSKIRVGLQLEDGLRLQDEFLGSQTLWDVLVHFSQTRVCLEEVPHGSVPVCIYMRDEVTGEQTLKQTTLQSLGLTSGSAIIRFIVRKFDQCENSQPVKTQKDIKREQKIESEDLQVLEQVKNEPTVCQEEQMPIKTPKSVDPLAEVVHEERDSGFLASNSMNKSSAREIRPEVDKEKPGPSSIGLTEPLAQSLVTSFIPFQGGGHRLGGANVPAASPEADMLCATSQEPFRSPGPSKPKKSKTDGEESESEPIDREPVVCHLDLEEKVHGNFRDLPDKFFEVTMDDVRRRFAELKSERHRLEEAPLITKALREAHSKEKMERYPKVVLRVLFPERYILQGFFRATESVGAVKEFVCSHLEEPDIPFYLFITPPRTELKEDSQSLFQAQLFPAAVVHFGSPVHRDHFLCKHLLKDPVSSSQADILVARAMPRVPAEYTAPVINHLPVADSEVVHRAPENYEEESGISDSNQQAQKDHGKVPKWLKLPGKK
ncbi:tether containing UBX domain for GLUT4 [Pseudophryne corroboree]|uniref:tether containing UBX domain for GLUT4 n=1 Tax=Pseudophryne corroboree TaxID=495146 RepID=UPI003081A224